MLEMLITIHQHFPDLFDWMRQIDDVRKKASTYELAAHLTACLAIFLFKSGSRNQYNQNREDDGFKRNFKRFFGFEMPHGNSVNNVLALLNNGQIEALRVEQFKLVRWPDQQTHQGSGCRTSSCRPESCGAKCLWRAQFGVGWTRLLAGSKWWFANAVSRRSLRLIPQSWGR